MSLIKKSEKAEISRLRKNYLAKRRRLIKKGVPEPSLPSFPLLSPQTPRNVINKVKDAMRKFISSSKYKYVETSPGVFISKHQINELKRAQRRANEVAEKQYRRNLKAEFIPLSERAWSTPGAKRTVESEHRKEKPRKYSKPLDSFKSPEDLEKYVKHLKDYYSKGDYYWDSLYKDNTIKAIQNLFGEEMSQPLVDRINNMDLNAFVYLMETQDLDLIYFYTEEDVSLEDRFELVSMYFDDYALNRYYNRRN